MSSIANPINAQTLLRIGRLYDIAAYNSAANPQPVPEFPAVPLTNELKTFGEETCPICLNE
jgi:hypothetical protein